MVSPVNGRLIIPDVEINKKVVIFEFIRQRMKTAVLLGKGSNFLALWVRYDKNFVSAEGDNLLLCGVPVDPA